MGTTGSETPTLIPEPRLGVGTDPPEGFDDLHVQRVLILILWVFKEGSQLHLNPLQQLWQKQVYFTGTSETLDFSSHVLVTSGSGNGFNSAEFFVPKFQFSFHSSKYNHSKKCHKIHIYRDKGIHRDVVTKYLFLRDRLHNGTKCWDGWYPHRATDRHGLSCMCTSGWGSYSCFINHALRIMTKSPQALITLITNHVKWLVW